MSNEDDNMKDVLLKDAPEFVKLLMQNYLKIKLSVELPIDKIEVLFGDQPHSWNYFTNYTFSDDKASSMDTADRESIHCWLWARVMGETIPDNITEEDIDLFRNKLSNPNLIESLFDFNEVLRHAKALNKSRVDFELKIAALDMPETVTLEGSEYVLKAIQDIIAENQTVFESKIRAYASID